MKAKDEALKIEKDFQKFFKVKYEFKNAVEKAMIEYAKAKATEAMKEIEKDCEIHKTKAGDEFSGISWAQVSRIMEKYGYEAKIPF